MFTKQNMCYSEKSVRISVTFEWKPSEKSDIPSKDNYMCSSLYFKRKEDTIHV